MTTTKNHLRTTTKRKKNHSRRTMRSYCYSHSLPCHHHGVPCVHEVPCDHHDLRIHCDDDDDDTFLFLPPFSTFSIHHDDGLLYRHRFRDGGDEVPSYPCPHPSLCPFWPFPFHHLCCLMTRMKTSVHDDDYDDVLHYDGNDHDHHDFFYDHLQSDEMTIVRNSSDHRHCYCMVVQLKAQLQAEQHLSKEEDQHDDVSYDILPHYGWSLQLHHHH
mmetsp:Transcript_1747/g.2432  ORF Transcript_1747/g.2432 Transcript_1747/m.2432 type:complete len:215 (+) Transcript_1747:589-1233(+)